MSKKILIADDDPSIVDSIQMILELEGYEVETTLRGETIYSLKNELPDLFLMDIWMSGQDGRDICRYLKKNPPTQDIPVVMISASRDVISSAKEAGAEDFIAKPFEVNDLLEKVARHLS